MSCLFPGLTQMEELAHAAASDAGTLTSNSWKQLKSKPWALSVADAADLIRRRRHAERGDHPSLLDRIRAFDDQLNAFITLTEDLALEQARTANREIAQGKMRGLLHGVPFAAKDIFDTAGILTSGHSRICIDRVPKRDATAVRFVREAGGVLLGKLATHEFAHGGPSFDLPWPPAHNPWNTACYTGGSSSGAGAALAARFAPAALGSDTGGSIRGPASFCGVTGSDADLRACQPGGRNSQLVHLDNCGPLARTAEDCAIALQVLAGFDPGDPGSARRPVPDYRAGLHGGIRGLRMGVLHHLADNTPLPTPTPLRHSKRRCGCSVASAPDQSCTLAVTTRMRRPQGGHRRDRAVRGSPQRSAVPCR